jgi:glycosyltransferase involved in cell wall biosynthesis
MPRPQSQLSDAAESSRERTARRPEQPLISVVVPTRDRPAALRRCLDALAAQTVTDRLEVIVVDDSSLAVGEVDEVVRLHKHARLVRGDGGGPAAARNAGARIARAAVACFTDDDCVPHRDWAERLAEALRRGAGAAAGVTLSAGGALANASEIVAHAPAGVHGEAEAGLSFAPSNNLACTRPIWESIPFDESYPDAAGEDRDWCARLTAAGHVLRPVPNAFVVHRQDLTLRRFLRQQFRYGQGAYRFHRRGARRPLEPPAFYAALIRSAFRHSFSVGLLVAAAQLATAAGFTSEWVGRRRRAALDGAPSAPAPPRAHEL